MGARKARPSIRSIPVRRRSSSSHKGGFCSITARKSQPNEPMGVEMVEEEGRYKISKIADNSIFLGSELRVGDVVLSVNGTSVRDAFINELIDSGNRSEEKASIVIRQSNSPPPSPKKKTEPNPNEITAEREGNEDVGIRFKVRMNKLYVSEIQRDSIFRDTNLSVGHCIDKINEMDFCSYADAAYALRIANKKGVKKVTLYLKPSQ
eukprot:scaffold11529_cov108-Cylindrotheca_fusiformis.AAC.6